ncbi:MAG: hypothetical protein ACO4AU_07995 [bacterium]|jgi:hypothetical protein
MSKADKLEKFERLAEKRTNAAIDKIRLVGNLSNRAVYDYTEEHIRQIVTVLEQEVAKMKQRFNKVTSDESSFRFQAEQAEED